MPQNKLLLLNTIAQQYYSNIYELDLEKQSIKEYSVSSMEQLETMLYEEWLHQIIFQLQFIQIKPFTEQTQIKKIVQELENDPFYMMEYQSGQGNDAKNHQMEFCYADAEKNRFLLPGRILQNTRKNNMSIRLNWKKTVHVSALLLVIFVKISGKSMSAREIHG